MTDDKPHGTASVTHNRAIARWTVVIDPPDKPQRVIGLVPAECFEPRKALFSLSTTITAKFSEAK